MDIQFLFENDNYLIVNKPPDLLINSDDENEMNTLQRRLISKALQSDPSLLKHDYYFVHRLDYSTSGVICLAKNKKAAAVAGRLFETRLVDKYYLAIVRGFIEEELTSVNIAIGYDRTCIDSNKMMCVVGENCIKPRNAVTKILVLEKGWYSDEPATKILLKPITGRRHQLRLHCHHIGHTIVGDYTYSNRQDVDPSRMYLHSFRLILPTPDLRIEVCTEDPFLSSDEMFKKWKSECVLNDMCDNSAFEKLVNYNCGVVR